MDGLEKLNNFTNTVLKLRELYEISSGNLTQEIKDIEGKICEMYLMEVQTDKAIEKGNKSNINNTYSINCMFPNNEIRDKILKIIKKSS